MAENYEYAEVLTLEAMTEILHLIKQGVPFDDACLINDVLPGAGAEWLESSEDFQRKMRKALAECKGMLIQCIHSGENVSGAKYLLEKLFGTPAPKKRSAKKLASSEIGADWEVLE